MNILMAASELSPLARSGDLADSLADFSGELRSLGHEVTVVIPYYRSVRENKQLKAKKTGVRFSVPVGPGRFPCEIYECKAPNGVQVFLVARDEYFDRSGLYGVDGRDYQDNAARFIFFTKCVLELARRVEPAPAVLHLHSWQTALAPVFVKDQRLPFRTVLTPHSLEYQGNFWSYDFGLTNLPGDYFSARGVEYFGSLNFLKGGLLFADAVVLPGERFVSAAQTSEYGCGLEGVLREQQHKLCGIPGAEAVLGWKPETVSSGAARAAFLEEVGLAGGDPSTLFVCFSDSTKGVGIDTLLAGLDRLLVEDVRVVLLGAVSAESTVPLEVARRKHRGKFVQLDSFDDSLARKALVAADVQLIPGPVEPQATWLRRGLLHGVAPVAAQCGGLYQLVRDWEPGRSVGNGFVYYSATVDALLDASRRAMRTLGDPAQKEALLAHARERDFSSAAAAREHVALYERLIGSSVARAA